MRDVIYGRPLSCVNFFYCYVFYLFIRIANRPTLQSTRKTEEDYDRDKRKRNRSFNTAVNPKLLQWLQLDRNDDYDLNPQMYLEYWATYHLVRRAPTALVVLAAYTQLWSIHGSVETISGSLWVHWLAP
jgi:hypothetical protein